MVKQRAMQQSQLLSEVAEEAELTIDTIKKAFKAYEVVVKRRAMEGKKIPLPGAMGYLHLELSRTKSQEVYLRLTDTHSVIKPTLRTYVAFSDPWREFINTNSRTQELITKLLELKELKCHTK